MTRIMPRLLAVALVLIPSIALAASEGGEPVDVGKVLLTPDLKSAIWNLAMFLVLFGVLAKFVWPKILEGLQAREEKIRGDLEGAEKARAEAEQAKAEFDQKIAEAHAESRKLLDQARADSDALRAKLQSETEADIARLRERAAEDIDRAKQQALGDLYATSAELATAVASKILQRQVTEADTQQLVEQSLAELNNKAG